MIYVKLIESEITHLYYKKKDTKEFLTCGSGCLKKIFPAADAKKLLDYAASLEAIRNAFVEYDYSGGGISKDDDMMPSHKVDNKLDLNRILFFGLIAYLHQGRFISSKSSENSTASLSSYLMGASNKNENAQDIINKYKKEALDMLPKLKKMDRKF